MFNIKKGRLLIFLFIIVLSISFVSAVKYSESSDPYGVHQACSFDNANGSICEFGLNISNFGGSFLSTAGEDSKGAWATTGTEYMDLKSEISSVGSQYTICVKTRMNGSNSGDNMWGAQQQFNDPFFFNNVGNLRHDLGDGSFGNTQANMWVTGGWDLINDNLWNMTCVVFNGDINNFPSKRISIYIDGINRTEHPPPGNNNSDIPDGTGAALLFLGARNDLGSDAFHLSAVYDEWLFFKKVLSSQQIQSIFLENFAPGDIPPNVTLLEPGDLDTAFAKDNPIIFKANATDDDGIANCTLFNNNSGTFQLIQTNISAGPNFTFNTDLSRGHVSWNVNCTDSSGLSAFASANFTLIVGNSVPFFQDLRPKNESINNTNLSVSFTYIDFDDDLGNCSLFINGTLNESQSGLTDGTPVSFSKNLTKDGHYSWNVNCDDGFDSNTSTERFFILDTVNPALTITNPSEDNTTISNQNLDLDISCNDPNLFQLEVNVTDSSGSEVDYNITNATTDTLVANHVVPLTVQDNYTVAVSCSDGHTVKLIGDYYPVKDATNDKLSYNTGDNGVSVSLKSSDVSLDDFSTTKLQDRYTFNYDFSSTKEDATTRNYVFVLEAVQPLIYLEYSSYNAHFISGKNWIDFNLDGDASYLVTRIADNQYEISISTTKTLLDFNSIGGLNIKTTHVLYQFDITAPTFTDNATNGSSFTKTGEDVQFNVTWTEENEGQYIFSTNESGSWVNSTPQAYTSGTLITVVENIDAVHNQHVGWRFYANDTAGNVNSTPLASFIVANTPPTAPTLIQYTSPPTAFTDSLLDCDASGSTDADNETITLLFEFRDSDDSTILQSFSSNSTFDCNIVGCDKGDTIFCHAKANDGFDDSLEGPVASISITNKAPEHDDPLLTAGTNFSNETLVCLNQSTTDADGDTIVNLFAWQKDGSPLNSLYLPFETNTNDFSGNSNDGVSSGGSFVPGKLGNALSINGSEFVNVTDDISLDFTTVKTWEIWFNRSGTGEETVFDKTNSINNVTNYKLAFDSSNNLVFSFSFPGPISGNFTFDTITEGDFNNGVLANTVYNVDSVQLSSGLAGNYTSQIFNGLAISSWNNITWGQELPYGKDLPDLQSSDAGADMSQNVLLLHMDELSANTAPGGTDVEDTSGNANHGVETGGVTFGVGGKFGTALSFDGVDDLITITDSPELDFGTGSFTIEAWVNTSDSAADRVILRKKFGAFDGYFLEINSGVARFLIDGGTEAEISGSTIVNDGAYHHIVGVRDTASSLIRIYVDGEEDNTAVADSASGSLDNNRDIGVGARANDANYLAGQIDEIALYNRTLSSSEILDHYKRGILDLNLSVRSCDDATCTGETFTDVTDSPPQNLSVDPNQYFQFEFRFSTENVNFTPKLFNVSVHYSRFSSIPESSLTSSTAIADNLWHYVAVTYDDSVSTDNYKMYLDGNLNASRTDHNTSGFTNNGLLVGRDFQGVSFFTGVLDEFRIYNHSLSSEQISNNFVLDYNKIVSNETTRLESYVCSVTPNDGSADGTTKSSGSLTVLNFIPAPAPVLLNPPNGFVSGELPEFNWTESFDIDPEDVVYYIVQVDNDSDFLSLDYNSTVNGLRDDNVSLDATEIETYFWRVLASDGIDSSTSNIFNFTYAKWNITFNVTSSIIGMPEIPNVNFTSCNLTGFDQEGDVTNPYGPFAFPPGDWQCSFTAANHFPKTSVFTANDDKLINITLSEVGGITFEEHTWLEALYNCIILKDCDLYNLLLEINETVGNVWEHTKPTDESVILFESVTNKIVNSTQNLTINYTVNIPIKPGYFLGTFLPVRIGFWFLNEANTTCFNQGDRPTGVADPYCQPLVIETFGPMGGNVSFVVELQPSLPAGNYSIKRIIDIDPNNVWINYGQEEIDSITVTEALTEEGISLERTSEQFPNSGSTNPPSQPSSSGGGGSSSGGGGGSTSVSSNSGVSNQDSGENSESPTIINNYYVNNTYVVEDSDEEEKDQEKDSSSSGITGALVSGIVSGVTSNISIIGLVAVVFLLLGGILTRRFVNKEKTEEEKK